MKERECGAIDDLTIIDRLPAVLSRVGMKRSWVYAEISAGRFPAPLKIGPWSVGWLRADVVAWVRMRDQ